MTQPQILWRDADAPDWRGAAIDRERYISAARLAAEHERLFARTWQLAGRADQVREPGDHFTFELAGESILVVNAGAAGLRAFYNVCRHRGRRLVEAGTCGRATHFRCPYHSWTYGLDGRLRGVPQAETFPDLDLAAHGLTPIAVDVWQGLVFVTLEPGGEALRDYLDVLVECLHGAFEPAVLVGVRTHEFAANWKTGLEAFIETNHIASLHPQVGKGLQFEDTAIAHFRRHSMTVVPSVKANRWSERRRQHWREWIADPAGLEYHYTIFPNISVNVFIWGLTFLFRCLPHPTDPERMRMDVWVWKRLREGETPPPPLSMPEAMGPVLEQDFANIPEVQRGVRSRSYRGPTLGVLESRIGHLHAVIDAYLRDAVLSAPAPV